MTLPFQDIRALTFDCYGTLIDWERGITDALAPLLRARGSTPFTSDQLLGSYAAAEARLEAGPYMPYRQVLAQATRDLATTFAVTLAPGDDQTLANSIRDWPAFPDSAPALAALARRFALIILSNIDRDLFALSQPKLGIDFAHIITAEDVRSYKPGPAHFHEALRRTGLAPAQVCHVAQSLFHDIAIARPLGFRTVWVNRRAATPRPGATPLSNATPDLELPTLAALAELA